MATTLTLDVHVHSTPECFDAPWWPSLLEADPRQHVFATPEWHKLWWEEFGSSGAAKDLLILTVAEGDEVRGVVPLYRRDVEGRKVLRFVGGIDLTDYLGPICAPEDRADVADALTSWLGETDVGWDEFDAHNMPVPQGFAEFLVEAADRRGLAFALEQEETAAVLVLPESWDAYEEHLDPKERRELRRKRKRLLREHPDARVRMATAETLEDDLHTFVEMHRGAEGHKGHFMKPEIATFFERVAHAFMPLGWLRLDLLEVGGSAIAATFGFEMDRVFYLYNSAYDPDLRRLSPGLMLVAGLLEDAIEAGFDRFDFLRGPERYKYQLGSEAVPLNNVRVLREPR